MMCGRFTQMYSWEELYNLYNLSNPLAPNIRPNWNAAPSQDVGVVVPENGGSIYKTMRWGLVPMWAKDIKIGNQAINSRLESVATKAMFRSAWKSRRCLIPASGYFEWKEVAVPEQKKPGKMPFYVSRKDGVPMTFAGRWGPDKLLTCSILTTGATVGIQELHTRMPVMLSKEGFEPWLAGENPAVDPGIDSAVEIRPVSPKMNKPAYNEPDCIEALVA